MFDKISYINETSVYVDLMPGVEIKNNILSSHVVIEDAEKQLLGEIAEVNQTQVSIKLLGEFTNGKLFGGIIRKPLMDAKVRSVNEQEIAIILGQTNEGAMYLGRSPFYNGAPVCLSVNNFFGNHFAIFGNSGSGKSCGTARVIQNVFMNKETPPLNANIIIFDVSGEYPNAFSRLSEIDPRYDYRVLTTSQTNKEYEQLRIPLWLLNANDLALLLMSSAHSQLPIVERMLKLARIFAESTAMSEMYKDHLIAKAIISILFSDSTPVKKKNDIFAIVETCPTPNFNMEATITGIGYTRKLRECFNIDKTGTFTESILFTEYVTSFVKEELDSYEPTGLTYYNLQDLEKALDFTLISEGWYNNPNTYADAASVRVRLHSLITSEQAKIFDYPDHVDVQQFLSATMFKDNKKRQIVIINPEDMDDSLAAVITKIFTRIIFDFAKTVPNKGAIPFHIIVEEAHRYIKNDNDHYLIGYNIFERVAKEGRKYGVILGVISQRPVELSDTVISQCSNFLIFKTNHPVDEEYIRKMIPNINSDIVDKQKGLQSGTCLGFGTAFKIPVIVHLDMPDPAPLSSNSDIVVNWKNI
ncbi:MAG: DUF87 domain-containing protein [Bacilli bacterium]|nr:DUF87 domain-containing protein [Bacilli bacterium]